MVDVVSVLQSLRCNTCGGDMIGDGYQRAVTCEAVEALELGLEPDANPVFCRNEDAVEAECG